MKTRHGPMARWLECSIILVITLGCLYNGIFMFVIGDCLGLSYDLFYRCAGEREFVRFPLLDPYEAVYYLDQEIFEDEWIVDLSGDAWTVDKSSTSYSQIAPLQQLAFERGAFLLYAPEAAPGIIGDPADYDWFILIPEQRIQLAFDQETDFLQYVQTLGIQKIAWFTPDDIFHKFYQTGDLPWIPEETKSWLYLFR